ncbi:hypothetical protein GCM10007938_17330 [Vibrio zhanjiangensis]|uniref:Outer membrane protein beta-barrel domain-containing protein n=1 Tax=Vibrio zhanjiangensis TaxID=1046128 RepID=A0ABQ6EZF3_9VIBR|nr:hypothetical protein [Vibrio zhanjiangensis]GLT17955.1 hypothetical protein GCM10007938_17330 [Vibrio zhanjiangensis]
MKRNILLRSVLAGAILAASATASAEGGNTHQWSAGMAFDQDLSAVVELDNKYRFTLGNDGAAFDYIFARGKFDADVPFTWYVGAGAWSEWDHDEFGVRVPLGVNWNFHKDWDMYAQVHPELDLHGGPELQVGGAFGIKYTF